MVPGNARYYADSDVIDIIIDIGNYLWYLRFMDEPMTLGSATTLEQGEGPFLVQEIVCTYQALMAQLSRRTGLSASRFALMRVLADADGDMGILELARQLGANAASVTRQVQDLEREGLVFRRGDPHDGRRSYIGLQPEGQKLLDGLLRYSRDFEQVLSATLSNDEMTSAAVTLKNLRAFVLTLR